MEVDTGAVPSRTVMRDPRTKRPASLGCPSSDSVVDDQKGILGGVILRPCSKLRHSVNPVLFVGYRYPEVRCSDTHQTVALDAVRRQGHADP